MTNTAPAAHVLNLAAGEMLLIRGQRMARRWVCTCGQFETVAYDAPARREFAAHRDAS